MSGAVKEVPALGLSVQYLVGEGRQLVVQTHVGMDSDQSEINAVLDRIFMAADRQKARYDVRDLESELRSCRILIKNAQEDIGRIEGDFQARMISRKAESQSYLDKINEAAEADLNEHVRSGRRGEWAMSAQAKRRVEAFEHDLRKQSSETERLEKERENALRDQAIIMGRHREREDDLNRLLNDSKALIG